MPSREPSTTCPSPLHFTGSLTCRLGALSAEAEKRIYFQTPGYVALTNICLEDGGCCPVKKDPLDTPPKIMSKSHQKNVAQVSCCDVLLSRYQH